MHSIPKDAVQPAQFFSEMHGPVNAEDQLTDEDQNRMRVLRWLQKTEDFPAILGFYNELARSFLLGLKFEAARTLLNKFMPEHIDGSKLEIAEQQ